jgi:excisionase family DNA binding protein
MLPEKLILTVREIAASLRVAERTVRRWADQGHIPAFKAGKQWRFKLKDVQQFVSAQDCKL